METFEQKLDSIEAWFASPRFKDITRLYCARQVAEQRGTIPQDYTVAREAAEGFYELLRELFAKGESITTFGPYSPGQAVAMKRAGIRGIYLGGWATSAKGSLAEDPGADLASYPLSQVPDEAAVLVRALLTADKNQQFARSRMSDEERSSTPEVDFRPFIIADADTGHGGDAHVRNLVRRFVEVGVSGYHIEDQRPGAKKCGHQGGKVLVPVDEQIKRLNAARFQLDVMGVPGIIVARTDAEAATLLESNTDGRDHPFILGVTNSKIPSYKVCYLALLKRFYDSGVKDINGHLLYNLSDSQYDSAYSWYKKVGIDSAVEQICKEQAGSKHASVEKAVNAAAQTLVEAWEVDGGLKTLGEAIADRMKFRIEEGAEMDATLEEWNEFAKTASFYEARQKAASMGVEVSWDCELARTPEGHYQVRGGIDFAIAKSLAVAPFADIIWMETKTANLAEAKEFEEAMHEVYPGKMLAYNLSPSFSWDTTGMSDEEMTEFPKEIGKLGYVFNFITYGGHQIDGLASEDFSSALRETGMLALAKLQRKFRLLESPYRTPQTLVGGNRLDGALMASSGRTATTRAMGKGSTQFQHLVQTEVPLSVLNRWLELWAGQYGINNTLKAKLRPHAAASELVELSILDEFDNKVADVVFASIQDRVGQTFLSVRDQNTLNEKFRKKRLMTLCQLFLVHRYKADSVHFVAPTEDNQAQTEGMLHLGIFDEVNAEIGNIIVASINKEHVKNLLEKDETELKELIAKN